MYKASWLYSFNTFKKNKKDFTASTTSTIPPLEKGVENLQGAGGTILPVHVPNPIV